MIREYEKKDLASTARVWLLSGRGEYSYLPDFQKLTESKSIDVFSRIIQAECSIWVFESDQEVVGFLAMKESLIDRLYVAPDYQKRGIGSSFIDHAKRLCPDGLTLCTHQQNNRAREFYEGHGFNPIRFGLSPAPESVPDVEYEWLPSTTS